MFDLLFTLAFTVLPWVALYLAIRHGPIRHPWHGGETALGFALFVGGIAFAAGFFGPMILAPGANQGPLLGIIYTGPIGFLVGFGWGARRQAARLRQAKGEG